MWLDVGIQKYDQNHFQVLFCLVINGQKNAKVNESYLSGSSLFCMIVVCTFNVRSTYVGVHIIYRSLGFPTRASFGISVVHI